MRIWLTSSLMPVCLLMGVGIIALPVVVAQNQGGPSRQARLDELLQQRRDILTRAVDVQMQQYLEGSCTLQAVLDVRRELQAAELDAAKTRAQRIAVLEEQLKIAQRSVALAEQRFRVGALPQASVLQAQAAVLSVEIALLREQVEAEPKDN